MKRVIAAFLTVAMILSMCVFSVSAEPDTPGIKATFKNDTINVSETDQEVELTVSADPGFEGVNAFNFTVDLPEGFTIKSVAGGNDDIKSADMVLNLPIGYIGWAETYGDDIYDVTSLAVLTINVPAGAKGTYEFKVREAVASRLYSTVEIWESGNTDVTYTAKLTVSEGTADVAVTGVELNKDSLDLTAGDTATLTATVKPDDATNKAVKWASGDESVATVADGVVTAVAAGTTTITVETEDGAKKATCAVTVKAATVAVTGVELNKSTLDLTVGDTETLTATVKPADATNKDVEWATSDADVATVVNGKVTAVGVGTATIAVKTVDGEETATCAVTVKAATVAVTGVELNKSTLDLTEGDTATLTATVKPDGATNKAVKWSSSNEDVATVADGVVTAVGAGTATITVETVDGAKKATCTVTVKAATVAVTGVELNNNTLELEVGETETLTANVKPADATNKAVTWSSDDTTVATVDENGKVTAVAAGTAKITVKTEDGEKKATCEVTVKAEEVVEAPAIKAAFEPATIDAGDADQEVVLTVSADPGFEAVSAFSFVVELPEGFAIKDAVGGNDKIKKADMVTNYAIGMIGWAEGEGDDIEATDLAKLTIIVPAGASGEYNFKVKTAVASKTFSTVEIWESGNTDVTTTATLKVNAPATVAVSGVRLNESNIELVIGDTAQLVAKVSPDDATNKNVTWKSYDEDVATVDGNGRVVAVGAGSTTVMVKTEDGGKTASCVVKVLAPVVDVTDVKLDNNNIELTEGDTATLTATVTPADATNKGVKWSSSDEDVATVVNGVVTAVKAGTATITVETEDGGKKASCEVTVKAVEVPAIKAAFEPAELNVSDAAQEVVLTVSANPGFKAVSAFSFVVELPEGFAIKDAVGGNDKIKKADMVNNFDLGMIGWAEGEGDDIAATDLAKLTITVPAGASGEYNFKVKTAVASKTCSTVEIWASGNTDITTTATLNVAPIAVSNVELDEDELEFEIGDTATLTATVTPADATNKGVKWSSSDEDVATVVNGVVTAVGAGTATITVETEDGAKKATCAVTVKADEIPAIKAAFEPAELNVSDAAQEAILTVSANPGFEAVSAFSFVVELPEGFAIKDAVGGNDKIKKADMVNNFDLGMIGWAEGEGDDIAATDLAKLTITVPAGASGEYNFKVKTAVASKTSSTVEIWASGNTDITTTATLNVAPIAVSNVELDEDELEFEIGDTATLTATVTPADATNKGVKWSSSDEDVATVVNGVVTAVGKGTATITVETEDGAKKATCAVTVKAEEIPDIKATFAPATINVSDAAQEVVLTVSADPGFEAVSAFSFVVELPEGFAIKDAVGGNDKIKKADMVNNFDIGMIGWAEGEGDDIAATDLAKLTITVPAGAAINDYTFNVKTAVASKTFSTVEIWKSGNTDIKTAATLKIAPIAVTGVRLSEASIELNEGDTATLTATVSPDNATNKTVIWSVGDADIATVVDGVVTAKSAGTTTVMVKTEDGNKTASCVVKVIAPVTGVTLNENALTLTEGDTASLIATIKPDNASNKNVKWSSSDENVATVADGVVTAVKAGSATITVETEDGGKKATCEVTVKAPVYPVTGVSLDEDALDLLKGETATLTATVKPDNASNKSVKWSSSDEDVATVVDGVVTAVGEGTATITVETLDGGKKATCEVTVTIPHEHAWTYSADGNVITAKCSCDLAYTLTLIVPESIEYNGVPVAASYVNNITEITGAEAGDVKYAVKGTTEFDTNLPVNAGEYTASISLGGKTATADFTIEKAEIKDITVNGMVMPELGAYAITESALSVPAGAPYEVSSISWSTKQSGNYSVYYEGGFIFNNGDTYRAQITLKTDDNHKFADAPNAKLNGSKAIVADSWASGDAKYATIRTTLGWIYVYDITLDANGGFVNGDKVKTDNYGCVKDLPIPTYSGYTFVGWFDAPEGGRMIDSSYMFNDDATIYAHWKKDDSGIIHVIESYKITIKDSVKGSVTASQKTADAGQYITITVEPDNGFTLETLKVTDKNGKDIPLKLNANGTYSFLMPASDVKIAATFMDDNSRLNDDDIIVPPTEVVEDNNRFVDVDKDDYFYDAVLWAAELGITTGVDEFHFNPYGITTRAQMVTFLWRSVGSPEPIATSCAFTDVIPGSYYEKAVLWAIENGITKGTSETTFSPDRNVTRAQAVTFLARMSGVDDDDVGYTHNFVDVYETDYYNNAVAWAAANGITTGTSATTFSPNDDCLRCQIVTFLNRYFAK